MGGWNPFGDIVGPYAQGGGGQAPDPYSGAYGTPPFQQQQPQMSDPNMGMGYGEGNPFDPNRAANIANAIAIYAGQIGNAPEVVQMAQQQLAQRQMLAAQQQAMAQQGQMAQMAQASQQPMPQMNQFLAAQSQATQQTQAPPLLESPEAAPPYDPPTEVELGNKTDGEIYGAIRRRNPHLTEDQIEEMIFGPPTGAPSPGGMRGVDEVGVSDGPLGQLQKSAKDIRVGDIDRQLAENTTEAGNSVASEDVAYRALGRLSGKYKKIHDGARQRFSDLVKSSPAASNDELDVRWEDYSSAQVQPRIQQEALRDIEGILKGKPDAVHRDVENGTLYALLAILEPGADPAMVKALRERIQNVEATYRGGR